MEANELRIGNYLKMQGVERPYRVFIIDTTETRSVTKSTPIPLTDEWMKDFGFKKVGINYEMRWLLLWKNKETGTIDFVVNEPHSGKRNARHLRYVHELQNLFFALTGGELTLKTETV